MGLDTSERHIGIIAEEAPQEIVTPRRDALNHSDYLGFLLVVGKSHARGFRVDASGF